MNNYLLEKFNQIENSRVALFNGLESLNDKVITYKINRDKWSVLQILFHLVKSEHLTLIALKKNLEDQKELKKSGIMEFSRSRALALALKSPFKFKAPPMLSKIPENYDIHELKAKWEKIRKSFVEIIETLPDALKNKAVFQHPKVGWLNLNQTLDFLKDHFDHHNRQIQKLVSDQKNN